MIMNSPWTPKKYQIIDYLREENRVLREQLGERRLAQIRERIIKGKDSPPRFWLVRPDHSLFSGRQFLVSSAIATSPSCYLSVLQECFSESASRAITTVVHELFSFGRSRLAAMLIWSLGRLPRMIGQ